MYGNLQGLKMCKGETVSWHVSALGSELDIHTIHFEGNRVMYRGTRRDVVNVFPHISHTVIMNADSIGKSQSCLSLTTPYVIFRSSLVTNTLMLKITSAGEAWWRSG